MSITEDETFVDYPCPEWCELERGHEIEGTDERGWPMRSHVFGAGTLTVETARSRSGS